MNNFKRNIKLYVISIILMVELIIIWFFVLRIYKDYRLSQSSIIVRTSRKYRINNPNSKLKSYYEPKSNTVETVQSKYYKGIYTINNDSLNERFNYPIEKLKDSYRIIILGDSFTYGLYVNTADNWPEKFEDMLNTKMHCKNIKKFEVINLAVEGYDIQYAVERFRLRGQKYKPDLVLWLLKGDDFLQLNEVLIPKSFIIQKELLKTGEYQKLIKKGIPYPNWNKAYTETVNDVGYSNTIALQEKYLQDFSQMYKNPLAILTFSSIQSKFEKIMKRYIEKRKNSFYFNSLSYIVKDKDAVFPFDLHPTAKGHLIIAKDVYNYFQKNKMIPCR